MTKIQLIQFIEKISGRIAANRIIHPVTNVVIVEKNIEIVPQYNVKREGHRTE